MHWCLSNPSIQFNPLPFAILCSLSMNWSDLETMNEGSSCWVIEALNGTLLTLLTTMATPMLLLQSLSLLWQRQSVSSQALWARAELLPYVALVSTACFPTVGQTLGLMLFLLKQNAGVTGLCEFWHSGCLSGSVPLCFWVCVDERADLVMFPVGSQWFFFLFYVSSVQFPHKTHVFEFWEDESHGEQGLETLGSTVALWLIGLMSTWYDSAALKPDSCFVIGLLYFLSSFTIIDWQ